MPLPMFACKTPLEMVVEPLYVLLRERMVVPGPFCVTEPLLLSTQPNVPVMPADRHERERTCLLEDEDCR